MSNRKSHLDEVQAGLFLLSALVLGAISIWVLGQEREIFATQERYKTSFQDVKGLRTGAPVRLGGITIGRVDQIGFSDELSDTDVYVDMLVNEAYLQYIREDSVVSIETQGLLGDRFLSISTRSSSAPLKPGSSIKSEDAHEIGEVLQSASTVVDNAVSISEEFRAFIEDFRSESQANLTQAIESLSNISKEIEQGNGTIHDLIYKKQGDKGIIADVKETTKTVRGIAEQIKSGEGVLHALIYEPGGKELVKSLSSAAGNISTTAENISTLAQEIETGKGIIHDAIYGKSPEGLSEIVNKLNETATNLRRASEALAEGGGTLGALLVDSQLYDNLVEVTDGAKRSVILRHAIRSSLNE